MDELGRGTRELTTDSPISQLIATWPRNQPFDALALLDQHPQLRNRKSAMLDLAYEEFCRRQDLGESVDVETFAARFAAVSRSLLHLLEVHSLFANRSGEISGADDLKWPVPGHVWLDFQLLEELGRGAFSRVYLAREKSLGMRLVVVKATVLGGGEAELMGILQHQDIVPVHSVQRDDVLGLAAIVMPFLSRVSLSDVIDAVRNSTQPPTRAASMLAAVRRLNSVGEAPEVLPGRVWPGNWGFLEGVLAIGDQLAGALGYAHCQGVLHCDVKPSNILITNDGHTKLLDFNLALQGGRATPLIGGTLLYMAPEQMSYLVCPRQSTPEKLDERIDIYGLGVTLFELAYSRHPFGALPAYKSRAEAAEYLWEAQRAGLNLPSNARTCVDPTVTEMIVRCLEFNPGKRPQSMAELSQFFRGQLKSACRVRRFLRVHRQLTSAAATLTCGGALTVGGWLWARDPYPVRQWQQGRVCYQAGDDAAAVEHLTAALENDLGLVDARFLRACALCRQKDFAAAYADFELLSRETSDGRPLVGLAHVAAAWQNDYSRAGALYGNVIERGYNSPLLLNNFGYCLIKQGQFLHAKEILRRALAANWRLPAAHHNLARAELMLSIQEKRAPATGEIEKALQVCSETAELDLDGARIYSNRARWMVADESGNRNIDKMFELLERAADRGATHKQLESVLPPNSGLRRDKRWQVLEGRAQTGTAFTYSELLLDPLDELQSWRTGVVSDVASR